jgi:hypothetical protein
MCVGGEPQKNRIERHGVKQVDRIHLDELHLRPRLKLARPSALGVDLVGRLARREVVRGLVDRNPPTSRLTTWLSGALDAAGPTLRHDRLTCSMSGRCRRAWCSARFHPHPRPSPDHQLDPVRDRPPVSHSHSALGSHCRRSQAAGFDRPTPPPAWRLSPWTTRQPGEAGDTPERIYGRLARGQGGVVLDVERIEAPGGVEVKQDLQDHFHADGRGSGLPGLRRSQQARGGLGH